MKAHLEPRWQRDGFDVYLYEPTPQGRLFYELQTQVDFGPDERTTRHTFVATKLLDIDEPKRQEPTMFLPAPILDALIEASQGRVTADEALLATLTDTQSVRDRMISLVERLIDPPPPMEYTVEGPPRYTRPLAPLT